jgi:hypothetical protein
VQFATVVLFTHVFVAEGHTELALQVHAAEPALPVQLWFALGHPTAEVPYDQHPLLPMAHVARLPDTHVVCPCEQLLVHVGASSPASSPVEELDPPLEELEPLLEALDELDPLLVEPPLPLALPLLDELDPPLDELDPPLAELDPLLEEPDALAPLPEPELLVIESIPASSAGLCSLKLAVSSRTSHPPSAWTHATPPAMTQAARCASALPVTRFPASGPRLRSS